MQLCHRIPYPPSDGGAIAMHQLTRGLLDRGVEVKVLAVAPEHIHADPSALPEDYLRETGLEAVGIRTRIRVLPALINLFGSRSYNVERFRSREMEQKLKQVLQRERFDIVQLEGLYLTPYIPVIRRYSDAVVVFRAHNIEHFIWERMASACRTPGKRQYLGLLARRLKKYESEVIHAVDGLAAITPVDEAYFRSLGFRGPTTVIPVGVPELDLPHPLPDPEPNSVFHLGSMDWRPNQEGIRWFLQSVWPLVTKEMPELTFYLAGKRMPPSFRQYASRSVVIAGEVPDALEFTLSKSVMVVPLLSGGGMRVKIVEGMAAARPIVSTPVGAEGIPCVHGEHLFLADTPVEMARCMMQCFRDPDGATRMGERAREFAGHHFQTGRIIGNLIGFYRGFGVG